MDLWVVDVMGPMKVETIEGHKYVLVMIDVFTRYIFVSLLRTKGEAATHLLNRIRLCQTQTGEKLKRLHSDGGKEFLNREVNEFLNSNGTAQSHTTPHTPQHNGIVERANRTIMDMAKSMMFHCDAYVPFWGEAVLVSAYLLRMSLAGASATCTPTELWSQSRPSMKHLHVFGCNAYYHVHKNNRDGKLDEHAKIAIFVGYDETNNTYYRLYDVNMNKCVISRDVKFYDRSFTEMKKMKEECVHRNRMRLNDDDALPDVLTDEMLQQLFPTDQVSHHDDDMNVGSVGVSNQPSTSNSVVSPPLVSSLVAPQAATKTNKQPSGQRRNVSLNGNVTDMNVVPLRGSVSVNVDENERVDGMIRVNTDDNDKDTRKKRKSSNMDGEDVDEDRNVLPRRGRGRPRKPRDVPDVAVASVDVEGRSETAAKNDVDDCDPGTYKQATECSEKNAWLSVIDDELCAHKKNNTWSVVKKNASMNVIDTKWVFTKKRDENGVVRRYKARMVARGFNHMYGVDYRETFAPVIKLKSLRLIIALSSTTNTKRKLAQLDVKTAFLNANVKEDIYVRAPEGMNICDDEVLKLNKALYGIKQAPHEWNNEVNSFISMLGFRRCVKDACVYVKMSKSGNVIVLGLFVDDMIISYVSHDEYEWFELKRKMMSKYELSDEGEANVIVGMKLTRKNGYLYVDQRAYVKEKLDEFGLHECREAATPGDKNVMLNDSNGEVSNHKYMQVAGSLIYALHTRPDITHATNIVCRFMSEPNATHMRAAMRVLSGTVNYGLRYRNDESVYGNSVCITGYCDADWAGDKTDRKSTSGYCVYVNNNLVTWNTRKQQSVSLSTAEAELMAIVEVLKEVKWMSMLLTEMKYEVKKPIQIWCDNQSAVSDQYI